MIDFIRLLTKLRDNLPALKLNDLFSSVTITKSKIASVISRIRSTSNIYIVTNLMAMAVS